MKQIIFLIIIIGAIGCKSRKVTTAIPEINTKATESDLNEAELTRGKAVFLSKCTKCHALKDPKLFTAAELEIIVPKMVGRVNQGEVRINEADQSKLLKYLLANCKE